MYSSKFNSHLKEFKNKHIDCSAIIFATGPTINSYIPFEGSEDCIKVGLNRIYDYPEILNKLDYYYYGSHYYTDPQHRNRIDDVCSNNSCVSFASAYEEGLSHGEINRGNVSPEDAIKIGSIPFENNLTSFTNDVSNYATLGHSIVFPPLQHILYMGVNKIYLVGCDGGFTQGLNSGDSHLLHWWTEFKKFKEEYYPDVEFVSINPVSLKGWFVDEYV